MDTTETATQVIEVVEQIDYTSLLTEISANARLSGELLQMITGMAVFFVVVVLCYFVYKFFRIFF